jgi:hypothetical protein
MISDDTFAHLSSPRFALSHLNALSSDQGNYLVIRNFCAGIIAPSDQMATQPEVFAEKLHEVFQAG